MKKLVFISVILFFFSISAYAQMGMMGGQQGQIGQGMTVERQQMGQGMMQGCQPMMGQGMGMMGCGMGMGKERRGYYKRWFQYGVTLMLQNADKLGLSDEQREKLYETKRKYSKDIIKQDAEMKIAEIDLGALLKKAEINLSEVKEAIKKVEITRTQIRYMRIEAFVEAKKVLTDEQRKSLKKLMEMRLAPGMRRTMSLPESEEGEEETSEEEGSGTDIHGH